MGLCEHLGQKNPFCAPIRYDKFSLDVTDVLALGTKGSHELVVHVTDPTEFAHIPIGKQRLHPGRHPSGIFYTSNSGIWQTVWLEPVRPLFLFSSAL